VKEGKINLTKSVRGKKAKGDWRAELWKETKNDRMDVLIRKLAGGSGYGKKGRGEVTDGYEAGCWVLMRFEKKGWKKQGL